MHQPLVQRVKGRIAALLAVSVAGIVVSSIALGYVVWPPPITKFPTAVEVAKIRQITSHTQTPSPEQKAQIDKSLGWIESNDQAQQHALSNAYRGAAYGFGLTALLFGAVGLMAWSMRLTLTIDFSQTEYGRTEA